MSKKLNLSPALTTLPLTEPDNPLEEFPALDKPATVLELKHMLQSLYMGIQSNIDRAISHTQAQITYIAERTGDLESKVGGSSFSSQ